LGRLSGGGDDTPLDVEGTQVVAEGGQARGEERARERASEPMKNIV